MAKTDRRVDAYIAKSADFAKPILKRLRATVHAACPDVEETIKWGFPHFMYKGMLCSMASFKAHCAFGFWKGTLVLGRDRGGDAMGHFGRITSLDDLPSDRELTRLIRKAVAINDESVTSSRPARRSAAPRPVRVPPELAAALEKNRKASATFDAFSPSHRREYADWIAEAKGEETRKRRVAASIEWLSAGKPRDWKYLRK